MNKDNNDITAVILAGGYGTRASSYTNGFPKAMLPLNKKILLIDIQLKNLYSSNVKKIFIIGYFLSEKLNNYLKKNHPKVKFLVEDSPKGTAGSVLSFLSNFQTNNLLILYGDLYFNFSLNEFITYHLKHKSNITIMYRPNDHHINSDLIKLNGNKIIKFHSKSSNLVNDKFRNNVPIGCYLINKKNLIFIKNIKKEKVDFYNDFFNLALNKKIKILGYRLYNYNVDVGTELGYKKAQKHFNSSNPCRLALIDLDGTVNYEISPHGIIDKDQIKLIPKSSDAINLLNEENIITVGITNKPQVAKGFVTTENLNDIFSRLEYLLSKENKAFFNEIFYCPHHPLSGFQDEIKHLKKRCRCRKPNTLLLTKAIKIFSSSIKNTFIVGDHCSDIKAGKKIGIWTYAVKTGRGVSFESNPHFIFNNLYDCTKFNINYHKLINNIISYKLFTSKRNKKSIICIGGQSRSGKTLLCHAMERYFSDEGLNVTKISLDDLISSFSNVNQDVYDRHNVCKYKNIRIKINTNTNFYLNRYNQMTRKSSNIKYKINIRKADIIIIEGIFGLSEEFISISNLNIYIDTNLDCLIKRQENFLNEKNIPRIEIKKIMKNRINNEFHLVEAQKKSADIILTNLNFNNP